MNRLGRRIMLMSAALILGVAPTAYAQDADRPAVDAEQLRGRLSPETIESLTRIAQRARDAGVPPQLIRRKVMEGVSKGVRGPRLERAIADYATRLAAARRVLGPGVGPEVLDAAAVAAERGIPPDRIRAFATANRDPSRTVVGLRVVTELKGAGVPTDQAMRAVQTALDRGVGGERLLALSAAVRRRVRLGETPREALRELAGSGRPGLRNAPDRDTPGDRRGRRDRPRNRGDRPDG